MGRSLSIIGPALLFAGMVAPLQPQDRPQSTRQLLPLVGDYLPKNRVSLN